MLYVVVPRSMGRAFNLGEIGRYHLPDVTLMVMVSVVADLVTGTVMLVVAITDRRHLPVRRLPPVRPAWEG